MQNHEKTYIYIIWLNVCIISYEKIRKAKNFSLIEKMPKTRSKIDYESSESEDSDVGDYDSYDDELDDSSVARRWRKKMLK